MPSAALAELDLCLSLTLCKNVSKPLDRRRRSRKKQTLKPHNYTYLLRYKSRHTAVEFTLIVKFVQTDKVAYHNSVKYRE